MSATRHDDGKLRLDLIPPEVLIELARVYTVGSVKYDDHNWRKGMAYSRCVGSALRHLIKWQAGIQKDPETDCPHLAHAAWNLLTLLVYELQGLGEDDRQKLETKTPTEDFKWERKT